MDNWCWNKPFRARSLSCGTTFNTESPSGVSNCKSLSMACSWAKIANGQSCRRFAKFSLVFYPLSPEFAFPCSTTRRLLICCYLVSAISSIPSAINLSLATIYNSSAASHPYRHLVYQPQPAQPCLFLNDGQELKNTKCNSNVVWSSGESQIYLKE